MIDRDVIQDHGSLDAAIRDFSYETVERHFELLLRDVLSTRIPPALEFEWREIVDQMLRSLLYPRLLQPRQARLASRRRPTESTACGADAVTVMPGVVLFGLRARVPRFIRLVLRAAKRAVIIRPPYPTAHAAPLAVAGRCAI